MKLRRIRAFLAHYRVARRYCNPLRAAWIAQAFVRALDGPRAPICADTGTPKWPGNCWNVRCQLGKTCCRADGRSLPLTPPTLAARSSPESTSTTPSCIPLAWRALKEATMLEFLVGLFAGGVIVAGILEHRRNLREVDHLIALSEARTNSFLDGLRHAADVTERARGAAPSQPQPQSERIPCATCTSEIWCEMNGCKRPVAPGAVGINGLTEAETSATASVMGVVGVARVQPQQAVQCAFCERPMIAGSECLTADRAAACEVRTTGVDVPDGRKS